MTPPSEKLKPCPFCGGEPKFNALSVVCSRCNASSFASVKHDDQIRQWNARVSQVPEASPEQTTWGDIKPDLPGHWWVKVEDTAPFVTRVYQDDEGLFFTVDGAVVPLEGHRASKLKIQWCGPIPEPGFRACERLNRKEGDNA